jgi:nucleoside-diphosphate-sugar epimerase
MNKVVLITGANGFVGRNVVKRLIDDDYIVYAIIRKEARQLINESMTMNKLHLIKGDLLNESNISTMSNDLMSVDLKIDYVIHLVGGGPLSINKKFERGIFDLNLTTTENLIKILKNSNKITDVDVFVYLSSLAAMGALNPVLNYDENNICHPILPYETAKKETEDYLKKISEEYSLNVVVFRPPLIYGKGNKEFKSIISLIRKGLFPVAKNKIGYLPMIHVEDMANAIKSVLEYRNNLKNNFNIFLICERSYSYQEIAEIVRYIYGRGELMEIPYHLFYLAVYIIENLYCMAGKPELINIYRVKSMCRKREVNCKKFFEMFNNDELSHDLMRELEEDNKSHS